MPTFIKPNLVHVQAGSGSGGLVTAVVAVVAVAGAAVAAWRWLAEPHPALEITLYSIVVAGVVAGVATVALVLRREFRCVPMRQKAALDAAMGARTGQALKSALEPPLPLARATQAAALPPVVQVHAQVISDHRTEALTAEVAALRAQIAGRPAEQHLHLHGISAEEVAAVVARQQPGNSIESGR